MGKNFEGNSGGRNFLPHKEGVARVREILNGMKSTQVPEMGSHRMNRLETESRVAYETAEEQKHAAVWAAGEAGAQQPTVILNSDEGGQDTEPTKPDAAAPEADNQPGDQGPGEGPSSNNTEIEKTKVEPAVTEPISDDSDHKPAVAPVEGTTFESQEPKPESESESEPESKQKDQQPNVNPANPILSDGNNSKPEKTGKQSTTTPAEAVAPGDENEEPVSPKMDNLARDQLLAELSALINGCNVAAGGKGGEGATSLQDALNRLSSPDEEQRVQEMIGAVNLLKSHGYNDSVIDKDVLNRVERYADLKSHLSQLGISSLDELRFVDNQDVLLDAIRFANNRREAFKEMIAKQNLTVRADIALATMTPEEKSQKYGEFYQDWMKQHQMGEEIEAKMVKTFKPAESSPEPEPAPNPNPEKPSSSSNPNDNNKEQQLEKDKKNIVALRQAWGDFKAGCMDLGIKGLKELCSDDGRAKIAKGYTSDDPRISAAFLKFTDALNRMGIAGLSALYPAESYGRRRLKEVGHLVDNSVSQSTPALASAQKPARVPGTLDVLDDTDLYWAVGAAEYDHNKKARDECAEKYARARGVFGSDKGLEESLTALNASDAQVIALQFEHDGMAGKSPDEQKAYLAQRLSELTNSATRSIANHIDGRAGGNVFSRTLRKFGAAMDKVDHGIDKLLSIRGFSEKHEKGAGITKKVLKAGAMAGIAGLTTMAFNPIFGGLGIVGAAATGGSRAALLSRRGSANSQRVQNGQLTVDDAKSFLKSLTDTEKEGLNEQDQLKLQLMNAWTAIRSSDVEQAGRERHANRMKTLGAVAIGAGTAGLMAHLLYGDKWFSDGHSNGLINMIRNNFGQHDNAAAASDTASSAGTSSSSSNTDPTTVAAAPVPTFNTNYQIGSWSGETDAIGATHNSAQDVIYQLTHVPAPIDEAQFAQWATQKYGVNITVGQTLSHVGSLSDPANATLLQLVTAVANS